MKEKLIEALKNEELEDFEIEYIIAVVQYIDSSMEKLKTDKITYQDIISKMEGLVARIERRVTGVDVIDKIIDVRSHHAHKHFGTLTRLFNFNTLSDAYARNRRYIEIISNYGGLFRQVSDNLIKTFEYERSAKKK